ncbi:sensor histidine kinase [Actinomycetes bacterium M1A6_2h]
MSRWRTELLVRPRRWTVRSRSAVASTVVVAFCLILAGGALLIVLYNSLENSARTSADSRTTQIVEQLESMAPNGIDDALLTVDSQVGIVQIVDPSGVVVAQSPGDSFEPLVEQQVSPGDSAYLGRIQVDENDDFWVAATGASSPSGPVTVVVGADREPVETVVQTVAVLLAVGGPLVIALVATATYRLVGAALSPVERIREQVSSVSTGQLAERIPVPDTSDEIARLATTMNEMLARLEAGHAAQQRFVGDASHELRSPLSTITAALELAASRPDLLDRDLVDESLLPEARRMRRLIEDLLLLARADESSVVESAVDVDLDDVLYEEAARIRGVSTLTVTTSITPVRVTGDRAALGRVVRNLVDNALRHAHSAIALSCRSSGTRAEIVVEDDGFGIAPADRTRVFDRFVRLDTPRSRESGGSGLGLAIVSEIVAAHHGTIDIGAAGSGSGTRVSVTLPT